jgi:two-component system, chemotaxis family, CheB/CheR fusion protein
MTTETQEPDPSFEALLDFVRDARGFDYTEYKRPGLVRRFRKRMDELGLNEYEEYRQRLEADPDEFAQLLNMILINVTGFFRDPETWAYLQEIVIPRLLERAGESSPIRVWSAGCASGEEPYTVAMLLFEALGDDAFRRRVKIYATDLDEEELAEARQALYAPKQIADVPEELRERYFQPVNHMLAFRSDARRAVVFGKNDLLQDAPISRVDLLVSRNTLMYFAPSAQERILANFYFSLNGEGFLVLGKAEALQSRTSLFVAYDLKRRVFVKNPDATPLRRRPPSERAEEAAQASPLRDVAFEQAPRAELIVDLDGSVQAVNHVARGMFGLRRRDVGRPLAELDISYRPVELRSLIDRVHTDRRPFAQDVDWTTPGGERRYLNVQVTPLVTREGELGGISVSFADITRHRALHSELEQARRDLETAYEELQSTVEELETTNEELQSTNEELETTNEELQSTNEELETMNEELQSTNEELETMNDELRDRTDESLRVNAFLGTILGSIQQPVIVVDRDLRITAWSTAATELLGLREDEAVGEHLLDLDIGLPFGELRTPVRGVLSGDEESAQLGLSGHNRRGRPIVATATFAPLRGHEGAVEGAIVLLSAESPG